MLQIVEQNIGQSDWHYCKNINDKNEYKINPVEPFYSRKVDIV